jgi:hypothetical protein
MGGQTIFQDPFELARTITDKQLVIAKQLEVMHFQGRGSPELLSAIVNALARNYATVVDNK